MQIIYDGAAFQEKGAGGIKRYFANLIRRLPPDFEPHFTSCRASSVIEPAHQFLQTHRFRRFRPQRLSVKLEKIFFGRVQDSRNFDLAHPTYYTLLTQREIADYPCPTVITVWDMIHELFPTIDPAGQLVEQKRKAVEAADAVLCISENTRNDLLARYRIDQKKVFVTHLAADLNAMLVKGDEPIPARPYFLYVGARAGYKNFDGLLSAFARAATVVPDPILVAVGPPFSQEEAQRCDELGVAGRVETYSDVSDRQLAAMYARSLALVYPSLYEGFGIPLLEAMQCGTLVVAANRASIPEVVGDAGMLFDPDRPDDLTDILVSLARGLAAREALIQRGHERARRFSWDETARQTIAVYRDLTTR